MAVWLSVSDLTSISSTGSSLNIMDMRSKKRMRWRRSATWVTPRPTGLRLVQRATQEKPESKKTTKDETRKEATAHENLLLQSFRGMGQMVFSKSVASSAFVTAGLMLHPYCGVFALCGSLVATSVTRMMKEDAAVLNEGLMGFNGALFAAASCVMLQQPLPVAAAFGAVGAAATAPISMMLRFVFSVFDDFVFFSSGSFLILPLQAAS